MWRKIFRVLGTIIGWGIIFAYLLYASHLAQEHRAEQSVTDVVITMTDSTELQRFASSKQIYEQLKRGGFNIEAVPVDSVDEAQISKYLTRNGFVSETEVYTTYSGEVHINIKQHKPTLRLLCDGYNSYVTAEGEVFRSPQGAAYYIAVVTGGYKPLFAPDFEGNIEQNFAELIEKEEAKLTKLNGELATLNSERAKCRERRFELRKSVKRKRLGESKEDYRIRKTGVAVEVAQCDEELSKIALKRESIEKSKCSIENNKKKLRKEYDDFVNLINFVSRISEDSFWSAEVVQFVADITSLGEITLRLIPRSGDFIVEFGRLEHSEEKLDKLEKFYDDGLSHIGWNCYKVIDVRYDKQVICTE